MHAIFPWNFNNFHSDFDHQEKWLQNHHQQSVFCSTFFVSFSLSLCLWLFKCYYSFNMLIYVNSKWLLLQLKCFSTFVLLMFYRLCRALQFDSICNIFEMCPNDVTRFDFYLKSLLLIKICKFSFAMKVSEMIECHQCFLCLFE